MARAAALFVAFVSVACALGAASDTQIRVDVPEEISRGGHAILILDDLETGEGEGFTFSVLAPAPDANSPARILAVTGIVGRRQQVLAAPMHKIKLVVPLNEKASDVLAGQKTIVLTLQLKDPGRPPLRVGKAFFSTSAKPD